MKIDLKIFGKLIPVAGLVSLLFYTGCYWDNEEYLYPQIGGCDTTVYTYSAGVQPILSSYCLTCHNNSSASSLGGNIKLGSYADVKAQADNGRLSGAINHASGFSPMPKGSAKLDDCKIVIIEKWIAAGALNN
ncbi:MAG TPA: hypothetical protein VHO90_05320 [Bacteroidales bacterium]|nr:hypothetical protein [Bacteroidales bacterium]